MILLWMLLGIAIAFCIGRYNESNKLFWILFTSFMVGIAAGTAYLKLNSDKQNSKTMLTQVCPTQNAYDTLSMFCTPMSISDKSTSCFVSQDITSEQSQHNFAISKVVVLRPTEPPRCIDSS